MQDKYQKEIEEILKNAGEVVPDESVRDQEKPLEDRPRAVRRAAKAQKPETTYSPKGRFPRATLRERSAQGMDLAVGSRRLIGDSLGRRSA